MRILAAKTLKDYYKKFPDAKQQLLSWYEEVGATTWNSPNELKAQFANASIINTKRVVFNIHGNKYRLIVDVEFRLKIVFVVWFGTHSQYDKIDVKKVSYVKAG